MVTMSKQSFIHHDLSLLRIKLFLVCSNPQPDTSVLPVAKELIKTFLSQHEQKTEEKEPTQVKEEPILPKDNPHQTQHFTETYERKLPSLYQNGDDKSEPTHHGKLFTLYK